MRQDNAFSIEQWIKHNRHRKVWVSTLCVLACLVVVLTFYVLIRPAKSMEDSEFDIATGGNSDFITFSTIPELYSSSSEDISVLASGDVNTTAKNMFHISFGAEDGFTDGESIYTGRNSRSATVATGNYDNSSIYGAVYGSFSYNGEVNDDGTKGYPALVFFNPDTRYDDSGNPKWWGVDGDEVGYIVQSGDYLIIRMKVNNVEGDMGDLMLRAATTEWDATGQQICSEASLSVTADEYFIYKIDLSEIVGKTIQYVEIGWPDAESGSSLEYILDYVTVRKPSANVFQTHFSVGEMEVTTEDADGNITTTYEINEPDAGYISPLSTYAEWSLPNSRVSKFSIVPKTDTIEFNTHNGYIECEFSGRSAPYIQSLISKDYSINYTIQEGDYIQIRIRTNVSAGTQGERYKVIIGGRDIPLNGSDSPISVIGGGRIQKDYRLSNANGYKSQQSYDIITIPVDQYAGQTIDWIQIQWYGTDNNYAGTVYIDHIRIGGLALGVDENSFDEATPLNRNDDITTVGSEVIDFRLYNYSNGINGVDATVNNSANSLDGFFEFRGRSRKDNYDNQRDTNGALDYDGYTDTLKDGSNTIATYNGESYYARRAKMLPKLQDGYPVFDGSAIKVTTNSETNETTTEKVQLIEDTSLGYLFGVGNHAAVNEYDPENTILKHPQITINGRTYSDTYTYYYNSADNAVDYDKNSNQFLLRNYVERSDELTEHVKYVAELGNVYNYNSDDVRSYGDFLPFTYWDGETIYRLNDDPNGYTFNYDGDNEEDYWFGMQMRMEFYQPENGMITKTFTEQGYEDSITEEMVFEFSGDDDVMVYIDDVLVLDLTGTHGAVFGSINFTTGEIKQYIDWSGSYDGTDRLGRIYNTTLKACFEAAGVEPNGGWNGETFADFSAHSFRFFYLERGTSVANCYMKFNLTALPTNSLLVGKQLAMDESGSYIESEQTYQFRVLEAVETTDSNNNIVYVPADGDSVDDLYIKPNTPYTILGDSTVYYTDENGYFYLKAGEHALFEQLTLDNLNYYFVVEVLADDISGQYSDVYYSVSSNEDSESSSTQISGMVTSAVSSTQAAHVDFVNVIDTSRLGTLKLSKTVDGTTTDEEFSFIVTVDGNLLPVGTEYLLTDSDNTSETVTVQEAGVIKLKSGQSAFINGILAGSIVRVKETDVDSSKYVIRYETSGESTTFTKDTDSEDELYVEFKMVLPEGVDAGNIVTVDTINKTTSLTVDIEGIKVLKNPDGQERSYTFKLQQVNSWNDHTTIGDPQTATVYFPEGTVAENSEQPVLFILSYASSELTGDRHDFWYLITEIDGGEAGTVYDDTKVLAKVTLDKNSDSSGYNARAVAYYIYYEEDDGTPAFKEISSGEQFTFTNTINAASLPATGGKGTALFYVVGGVLLCLSLAIFIRKSRLCR